MTWLLTGGAGYIGAHVAYALRAAGHDVVAMDDLSSGVRERLPEDVPFVQASVLDADAVRDAVRTYGVTGAIHFAAKKAVAESMADPLCYYRENVGGLETLLRVLTDEGVDRMVFSSSAAVYGMPDLPLVTEDSPTRPINPYGETKLVGEWMLRDVSRATGLRYVSLRYFNVAGAGSPHLGDTAVANLIPMVFRALDEGKRPQIFGDDYPTPDGSCIRDYIHVVDLADAHVVAAERLTEGPTAATFNVGRGEGASVKEVVDVVRRVSGIEFEAEIAPRRPGDPARLVGSADAISRELGWKASHNLDDMVSSAWEASRSAR